MYVLVIIVGVCFVICRGATVRARQQTKEGQMGSRLEQQGEEEVTDPGEHGRKDG